MNPAAFASKKQGPPKPPPFMKKKAPMAPAAGAPGPGMDEEQDPNEIEPDGDQDDAQPAGQLMPAEKALFMPGTDTCGNCMNYDHQGQTCSKVDAGDAIQPDDRCFVFFEPMGQGQQDSAPADGGMGAPGGIGGGQSSLFGGQ